MWKENEMTEKQADAIFYSVWVILVITVLFSIETKSLSNTQIQQTREQKLECFDKAVKSEMEHGYAIRLCEIE